MNKLEALDWLYKNGYTGAYEPLKQSITELETMKAKVKRYFELDERYFALQGDGFQPECNELYKLAEELKEWSESNG